MSEVKIQPIGSRVSQWGEGPISYARRVVTFRPDLATSIDAVTGAYIRANFIDDCPEDADTLRKTVRRVRLSILAGA